MAGVSSSRAHNETYRQLRPSNTASSLSPLRGVSFPPRGISYTDLLTSGVISRPGAGLSARCDWPCKVNIGLARSLDFGHTHTHTLTAVAFFTVRLGVISGYREGVITTVVHTLEFKIKTSRSNNNLQTGFNTHRNKPRSTTNPIFIGVPKCICAQISLLKFGMVAGQDFILHATQSLS